MKHKLKHWLKKKDRKSLFSIAIVIGIVGIIVILLTTNLLLELHYILGNDVIIDLDVDKEYLTLVNGEMDTIEFTTSVKTNPFCKASCSYTFQDISFSTTIESNSFELKTLAPVIKSFAVGAPTSGTGSKLYRLTMECSNERTVLCKTSGRPTERNILVTVDYELSVSEEQKKQNANEVLLAAQEAIQSFYSKSMDLITTESTLQHILVMNFTQNLTLITNAQMQEYEKITNGSWLHQEYDTTKNEAILFQNEMKNQKLKQAIIEARIIDRISRYNSLIEQTNTIAWFDIRSYFTNNELQSNFSQNIKSLENEIFIVMNASTIYEKEQKLLPLFSKINKTIFDIKKYHNETMNTLLHQTHTLEKVYCSIEKMNTNNCLLSQNFTSRSNYCSRLAQIKTDFLAINNSWITEVNYENITYPFPMQCEEEQTNISIHLPSLQTYNLISVTSPRLGFFTPQPQSSCCIFESCKPCCTDTSCTKEPIIFLHGHAINDKTSPDISLDSFNQIQKKLEEDEGIINAGRISSYDYINLPKNIWGKFGVPFSIKTSYYYNVYKQSDSNVIVKTNNEGIDSYAVTFKEIVDKVLFKLNAKKATIIAHSMGGLVTRRYLQIFGTETTDKVILIGTPNNGTYDLVSSFCGIFGSELECRDLKSGSLFLNKLNTGTFPNIPIYMLVGTGCDMQGEDGDGIVITRSAELPGATNYFFNGNCDGTDVLHIEMIRNIEKYPKVYNTVASILSTQ